MACIRLSYCYAQWKFGSSISASSFIALISQSNALVQEKMSQCDVPDTFLTPCFFTRGYKLLSLVLSLPQLCFPVTPIFTSHVGCFMFFEFQINKQHAYLLHVRKMQNVCFIKPSLGRVNKVCIVLYCIWPILKQITECDFEKVWKCCAFTLMKFKYNQMCK